MQRQQQYAVCRSFLLLAASGVSEMVDKICLTYTVANLLGDFKCTIGERTCWSTSPESERFFWEKKDIL
jgi:hypothetical protein